MFHQKPLFLLALTILTVSVNNLAFDLRSVKYQQASDFWTVDVPCIGGSGSYSYQFDLPTGWKNDGNKIKIPTSSTQQTNNQYVVRCRVKDTGRNQILQRSLVFKPFSQGSSVSLEVIDRDYFFGNSDLSAYSGSSSIHGIDVLQRLNSLTQNIGTVGFFTASPSLSTYSGSGLYSNSYGNAGFSAASLNVGGQYNANGYSGSSSLSSSSSSSSSSSYSSQKSSSYGSGFSSSTVYSQASYYNGLPSISQLESYISGGDIVEIIQAIQLVVDSKIKCEAKSAYLSDFLGRIYGAIQIKRFKLSQLKAIVSTAVTQVAKLTAQIQQIKSQQSSLRISELQYQLDTLVKQLKVAYDEYNNFNSNYSSYETEINSLQRQINVINQRYSQVQQKLESLKRSIQGIDSQIAEYQERIRKLKQKRSSVQSQISSAQSFIKQNDVKITELRQKITFLKNKITNSATQKEKLKQTYLTLQKQVDSIKQSLKINQAKFSQYEQKIVSISIEIERYQKQTSELQVKQVVQCIQNLQSAITQIRQSIDFVAYKCYDARDIQIDYDKKQRRGSYHFGQNQWYGYINKCYGDLAEQIRNRIASSFKNQVIQISTINVFSDIWKQNYGSCFQSDIERIVKNENNDKSFSFSSDFSCSAEFGGVQTKSGVIQNISSNQVTVRGDDGKDYVLRLGSCSKFQGQGRDFIPRRGNNVFWKGSRKDNSYNLHSCTCY